jgi:VanZ family protein
MRILERGGESLSGTSSDVRSALRRVLSLLLVLAMVVPLFLKAERIGQQELFPGPYLDKLAHAVYFGIVASALDRGISARSAIPALVSVAAIGAADEVNQRSVPGRSADFLDWCADSLGAIFALRLRRRVRPGA